MEYEEFLKHYVPELQLLDALDGIKRFSPDAAEILDRWASHSSTEKSDEEPLQTDQNPGTSAPGTQSP
jgi:hypothetical protein